MIVGITIGSGIFETTPMIAANTQGPIMLVGVWMLGGAMALAGSLCYAELATMYPRNGGDYVYLTKGFGRWCGFFFVWIELLIIRPGNIGAMSLVFAHYAARVLGIDDATIGLLSIKVWLAVVAILGLSFVNVIGVQSGKWTQNLLTSVKVIGLGVIIFVSLALLDPYEPSSSSSTTTSSYRLAIILVMFTYGGWNNMSYVASEVRYPEKNILKSLVLGSLTITGVYVLFNLAMVQGLGFHQLSNSDAVATDVMTQAMGEWAARGIGLLVCVSCLGAMNGMIFTGSRIYHALGIDHPRYRWLGHWDVVRGVPVRSLLLQMVVAVALVVGFGRGHNSFSRLVVFTTPPFWSFMLLVGLTLLILRIHQPAKPRPFRVPFYPLIPLLFIASSIFMLYASFEHAWNERSWEVFWAIFVIVAGLFLILLDRCRGCRDSTSSQRS